MSRQLSTGYFKEDAIVEIKTEVPRIFDFRPKLTDLGRKEAFQNDRYDIGRREEEIYP